jgi:hypothetical protein
MTNPSDSQQPKEVNATRPLIAEISQDQNEEVPEAVAPLLSMPTENNGMLSEEERKGLSGPTKITDGKEAPVLTLDFLGIKSDESE